MMKRIALIATTGLLALMLTACGGQGTPKPTANENTMQQQQPGTTPQQQQSAPNQEQR
ncbi:hypothetical protein [Legionella sp.]|uniref:hypothetical protein n=1 Tax=Legionella sp. TaxID=459 RepID=UPI0039E552D9